MKIIIELDDMETAQLYFDAPAMSAALSDIRGKMTIDEPKNGIPKDVFDDLISRRILPPLLSKEQVRELAIDHERAGK
jgi:hypothetical protein